MNNTDRFQVWTYTTRVAAGHDWGRINTKTVETLDFDRGVIETHTTGTHEGERVDQHGTRAIDLDVVTPEAAAEYRRCNGYTRIK